MTSFVISSGHGKYIRGAAGSPHPPYLEEVDEARRVVNRVAELMKEAGHNIKTFHDDVSTTQNENLNRIVNYHNAQSRDLDISVHFNAYNTTDKPMGTECLYITQQALAAKVSAAVAASGFINRGPKKRTDLYFLNNTAKPAILIEVCFVDSKADADLYRAKFEKICNDIAALAGGSTPEPEPPIYDSLFHAKGSCSWFGGPNDTGVSPSEGLAFFSSVEQAPHLFRAVQPSGTTGLARRLNEYVNYIACRWDYNKTPKSMLASSGQMAKVTSIATGRSALAFPADWGPNTNTGRVADLSRALLDELELNTDEEVEVIYPYKDEA